MFFAMTELDGRKLRLDNNTSYADFNRLLSDEYPKIYVFPVSTDSEIQTVVKLLGCVFRLGAIGLFDNEHN